MKTLLALIAIAFATPALASLPHDRVCVGSTDMADGTQIKFMFQWEYGRSYDKGDPNQDPVLVSMEASSCWGDYMDSDCTKSNAKTAKYANPAITSAPAKLLTAKGQVFFDGTLTFKTETLTGKIDSNGDGTGTLVPATIPLHCIAFPRTTLEPSTKDPQ